MPVAIRGLLVDALDEVLARIIHERFCCNRQSLTRARRARLAGKARLQGQDSHVTRVSLLALVARDSAISRRTVMNNAGSLPHLLIGASGCPLSDIHFQNLNLSLSMPTLLTMLPSTYASKWPPGTSLSTVFMQRPTARSSSCRSASEGAGSKGIVLKDFLSSGVSGSVALTNNELKTKQMDEAIAGSVMR